MYACYILLIIRPIIMIRLHLLLNYMKLLPRDDFIMHHRKMHCEDNTIGY